jgi:predicted CXXCH cytochrome family protein
MAAGGSRQTTFWGRLGPRKQRLAIAGLIVAAAIFAAGWTPPAATVHDFTVASDFDTNKDSGCTNSGEGCHGSEDSYVDFNDYHPDTPCSACHSRRGVGCIPCHSPEGHECTDCHDGTMDGASDCVRLVDPYPSGHYRETTHTAMGTDMDAVVRAAEDGEAQLTCGDCHSRELRSAHTSVPVAPGSDYGSSVGCGECHNDVRSFGMAEVLNDWPGGRCEDCHRIDSSTPMHATAVAPSVEASGTSSCGSSGGGCHEDNDLHALHPDAPATCDGSAEGGEPGCHDLDVESHKPVATACGGGGSQACHRAYEEGAYSHEDDRSVHSPETRLPATDRSYRGVACGSCHHMNPDGTSLVVEHELLTSEKNEVPLDGCRNCHNHAGSADAIEDDWAARDSRGVCATCHDGEALDSAHEASLSGVHTVSRGSEGCASTGAGCHPGADLSAVGNGGSAIHDDCLTCHDRTASGGNLAYNP